MKIFERTRWVKHTAAKIVRPYWNSENEVMGYIIKLKNGQEIARLKQHIKLESKEG